MSGWHMAAAHVRGRGHRMAGTPCQDRAATLFSCGVRVVALADGAGSAPLSHLGAQCALKTASRLVASGFDELCGIDAPEVAGMVSRALGEALGREAEAQGCDTRDLSSTLLLAAVRGRRWLALHVGDGALGIHEDGELRTLSEPENGAYRNETWFTTSRSLREHLRVYRGNARGVSGFALMSDGVQPSLYEEGSRTLAVAAEGLLYANARMGEPQMGTLLGATIEASFLPRTRDDCSVALLSRTRFGNFDEYERYRRRIARRIRRSDDSGR